MYLMVSVRVNDLPIAWTNPEAGRARQARPARQRHSTLTGACRSG